MRAPLPLLAAVVLAAGCDSLTTVTFGAKDGLVPLGYADSFSGLPNDYSPGEIADGKYELLSDSGTPVTLSVKTNDDGSRDVTLGRVALLLDADESKFFHLLFGDKKIEAITGVSLALVEMDVEGPHTGVGTPVVSTDGQRLQKVGDDLDLSGVTVGAMKTSLLADEAVSIPFSLSFHLAPDAFDLMTPNVWLYVSVQPTLTLDALGTL